MDKDLVAKIKSNPKYQELVTKRSKFAWQLSIVMLVVYYAFILLIAFAPQTLGIKLGDGVMTLGIPLGVAVIVIAFALTGVYIKRANTEFEDLTNEIKKSVRS